MRIDIVSIFPEYFTPLELSIVGRATRSGALRLAIHDLRDWTTDRHRTVDDSPYGGGPGMVMKADVWGQALDDIFGRDEAATLVIPTPSGERLTQSLINELAERPRFVIACGRYEGIDSRVAAHFAAHREVREVSVADAVVAGGEVAALFLVEAVARLLPGVLGNAASAGDDSFASDRAADAPLEGGIYTRPPVWRGLAVPDVLLSGDHGAVAAWREQSARHRTRTMRPDLLAATGDEVSSVGDGPPASDRAPGVPD